MIENLAYWKQNFNFIKNVHFKAGKKKKPARNMDCQRPKASVLLREHLFESSLCFVRAASVLTCSYKIVKYLIFIFHAILLYYSSIHFFKKNKFGPVTFFFFLSSLPAAGSPFFNFH